MGRKLDAREYKLLLNPHSFDQYPTLEAINAFWDEHIRHIVQLIDPNAYPFQESRYRLIRFLDTQRCELTNNDLILRTRQKTDDQFVPKVSDVEVTLKLRMPDQFVVRSSHLARAVDEDEGLVQTKFEEDIGPLEVLAVQGPDTRVVRPIKISTRNRFSLSSSVTLQGSASVKSLAHVFALFPGAEDRVAVSTGQTDLELVAGPLIHEYAFKKGLVTLDGGIDAEFTMSLWCFESPDRRPDIVELSFVVEADDGRVQGSVARQAYNLFNSFQRNLASIIDPENTSKTSLSLPPTCGR